MKYFTKKWYRLCQKTYKYLLLEADSRAELFSETFYQEIYDRKFNEFLKLQEKIAAATIDDLYPKEMPANLIDESWTLAELSKMKAEYALAMEENSKAFVPNPPVNVEKVIKYFYKSTLYDIRHAKKNLPTEIYDEIADIRVYALGICSDKVLRDVTIFCETNDASVLKTMYEYKQYLKKSRTYITRKLMNRFDFHDSILVQMEKQDESLLLTMDNSNGYGIYRKIRFLDYEIIKQDASIENCWWLYEEVYFINGKYEIHVLLQSRDTKGKLIDFIVSSKEIQFIK